MASNTFLVVPFLGLVQLFSWRCCCVWLFRSVSTHQLQIESKPKPRSFLIHFEMGFKEMPNPCFAWFNMQHICCTLVKLTTYAVHTTYVYPGSDVHITRSVPFSLVKLRMAMMVGMTKAEPARCDFDVVSNSNLLWWSPALLPCLSNNMQNMAWKYVTSLCVTLARLRCQRQ